MTNLRSGNLLATKLVAPLPRWRPVARPRLLGLLEAGTRGPLTVLAAPPGAGKTILLASWMMGGHPPGPVAWVTVDRGDRDPVRFWAHVVAALRSTGAVPPDGLLAGLGQPAPDALQGFLAVLVNGLAELPGPVVLVLDDLHEAPGPTAAGLQFLLRHAPPQLRLVVATRADPPLSLNRLRVAGQLTEIRAAALAFTPAEAGELLAGLGVELPDPELETLWRRTEGWVAGLRLAALSLRDHPDPGRFVAEFAGDDHAVAGYLVEEVLARQPSEVQEFLLRTCVADRLCGGLADALTGRSDGERMLALLERDQAFTTGLGRSWYRYHPLFAELLRAELRHRRPEDVPELHRRAAAWQAANGLVEEAVDHALAGGDPDGAAGLLAAHGFAVLLRGRAEALRELLGRLPAGKVRADRDLAVVAGAGRLALGELEEADAWLELAGARRRGPGAAGSLAGLLRAQLHGDVDGVVEAAGSLLASPPEAAGGEGVAEADRRALALSILGAAELWSDRLDDAAAHLEESRALADRGGRDYLVLDATGHLALLEAVRGHLARAHRLGREAAEMVEGRGWSASAPAACGELALAWVAWCRDDLDGASDALKRAGRAARAGRDRLAVLAVALAEARLAASGRREAAGDGLARLRAALAEVAGWRLPRLLADAVRPAQARLLLAAGNETGVAGLLGDGDAGERPVAEAVILARLRLARGAPGVAAEILAPLHGGQAPPPHPATLIEAWLLDAVAHRRLADHAAAAESLERALALAAPEGHPRVFVEGGAPVRALLADHLHRGTAHRALAEEMLEGMLSQATGPIASVGGGRAPPTFPVLVESLSEREQVVLRYLPSMLSAGEIAAELYVSVNTVKSHIKSIYRKLDANRRWDAVRRARQLHLL